MSPKVLSEDKTSDNTSDTQKQSSSSHSSHSADIVVDSLAFGHQSDRRSVSSDSQSVSTNKNQLKSGITSNLMKNQIFGFDMPFDIISTAFASTVAIGGIIGYVKAKSTYSLIAGLVFGGILGFGAYQTSVNPRNYYLTLGTSAVLGTFMGYRAMNSGKFMPAGLVATLSALMVVRFAVRFLTDTNYVRK